MLFNEPPKIALTISFTILRSLLSITFFTLKIYLLLNKKMSNPIY